VLSKGLRPVLVWFHAKHYANKYTVATRDPGGSRMGWLEGLDGQDGDIVVGTGFYAAPLGDILENQLR